MIRSRPIRRRLRRRTGAAVAVTAALALTVSTLSGLGSPTLAAAADRVFTVTVSDQVVAGSSTTVQPYISVEANILATPQVLKSPTLRAMFSSVGGGAGKVRFGANGSGTLVWGTPTPAKRISIGSAEIANLADFAEATDQDVILANNLFVYDTARATAMLVNARQQLGERLVGAQFGNEPDLFWHGKGDGSSTATYPPTTFVREWNAYRAALAANATTAGVPVYGPETTGQNSYHSEFVAKAALRWGDVLTAHNYFETVCGGKTTTVDALVSTPEYRTAQDAARQLVTKADGLGARAVLSERNSVSCSGQKGVDNTVAQALWVLDSQLMFARAGIDEQYLHTHQGVCDAKPGPTGKDDLYHASYYSFWCAANDADAKVGKVRARNGLYGLLAARTVGDGQFLTTSHPNEQIGTGLRFYAVRSGARTTLVAVNFQATAATVRATVPGPVTSARQTSLRSSTAGANLSTTTGVGLGGQTVTSAGTIAAPTWTPTSTSGQQVDITVPAYSGTIVEVG